MLSRALGRILIRGRHRHGVGDILIAGVRLKCHYFSAGVDSSGKGRHITVTPALQLKANYRQPLLERGRHTSDSVSMTMKCCTNGAITLYCMNFSGYVGHATIFS